MGKRLNIVQQAFGGPDEMAMIPSNYIDLHDGWKTTSPIHLRQALTIVRDNGLIHRWRVPTFQNRHTLDEMPILKTMQFGPWAAFALPRRTSFRYPVPIASGVVMVNSSEWFTYFCFSREEDLLMFRIVWS